MLFENRGYNELSCTASNIWCSLRSARGHMACHEGSGMCGLVFLWPRSRRWLSLHPYLPAQAPRPCCACSLRTASCRRRSTAPWPRSSGSSAGNTRLCRPGGAWSSTHHTHGICAAGAPAERHICTLPIQALAHARFVSRSSSTSLGMLRIVRRAVAAESVVQRSWASGAALHMPSRACAAPPAATPSATCDAREAAAVPSQHSLAQVRLHVQAPLCSP